MGTQLRELAVQRRVKKDVFHCRVGQAEPLLHEVHPQHGYQCKGWAAILAFGVVRCDEADQVSLWHHPLHLREEITLARALCC